MSAIIHLHEAGRLPTILSGRAIAMLIAAGVRSIATASPTSDPPTTIICVPPHAVTPAAMIINEVARRHAPVTQDAYTGGSLPGAAEAVQ